MRPYYYLGRGRGLTALTTGQLFFVNTDARDLTPWFVHLGLWESFVDDILCALAEPGQTFFDVGANQGYYSVKVGGLTGPNGMIYAFEPNPALYPVVIDNMNINGFDPRSKVFNVAAGDGLGQSTLLFNPNRPGGGQVGMGPEWDTPEQDRISVDVMAIDDLVPPDCVAGLIKIDVEGYEPLVLRGMQRLLERSPEAAMVLEVSYGHWARFGDPAAMLRAAAGDRRVFRIFIDGHMEEIHTVSDDVLDHNWVCYMLLLPRTDAAWDKVKRFAKPDYVPPQRASFLRRLVRKLKRMASA